MKKTLPKKTKVRSENSPPKKSVLEKLSHDELAAVQGGRAKKKTRKKATKKKATRKTTKNKGPSDIGIKNATSHANDVHARLPF